MCEEVLEKVWVEVEWGCENVMVLVGLLLVVGVFVIGGVGLFDMCG